MTAITRFDKPTLRRVGPLFLQALQVEAAKLGLKVEQAGGSFTPGDWTAKFKITPIAPAEGVKTIEQEALEQLAPLDGFTPAMLSRTLNDRDGKPFTVVGYLSRRRKMPYMIERPGGKKQICDARFVREALRRAGIEAKDPMSGILEVTDPPSRG